MSERQSTRHRLTKAGLGLIALSCFLPNVEACNKDLVPATDAAKEIAHDPATALLFGSHFGALLLLLSLIIAWRISRRIALLPLIAGLAYAVATNVYLAVVFLAEMQVFAIGPLAGLAAATHALWRKSGLSWTDRQIRAFSFSTIGPAIVILLMGPRYGGVVYMAGSALLIAAGFGPNAPAHSRGENQ